MKRRVNAQIFLLLAIVQFGMTARVIVAGECPTDLELEVITLISQLRADNGLNVLEADGRLVQVAREHSVDMANNCGLQHNSCDGTIWFSRILTSGYPGPLVFENIAFGPISASSVFQLWFASPPHRAIMLDNRLIHIGVGFASGYWTVDFGGSLDPVERPPCTCCLGVTGNVDADPIDIVDIADLTFLIDHLFINFPVLLCPEEGNVDGDLGKIVDIADLTFLIDHLFINFPPTAACQ